jgi:hypothetical protein
MLFGKTKKRIAALEEEVKALKRELGEICAARESETEERASLSKTLNEWVWGEEKHESNGTA